MNRDFHFRDKIAVRLSDSLGKWKELLETALKHHLWFEVAGKGESQLFMTTNQEGAADKSAVVILINLEEKRVSAELPFSSLEAAWKTFLAHEVPLPSSQVPAILLEEKDFRMISSDPVTSILYFSEWLVISGLVYW